MHPTSHKPSDSRPALNRVITLPWLVLYGLGVTIGAGIYVLLGMTVARAGIYAPLSFVAAGIVMIFSAASFAELSGRFPVSAGEAAYVRSGFRSNNLSLLVGLLVIASGTVSAAAITVGSAGYIREFIALPEMWLALFVVLTLGAITAFGIMESVVFASLFTLIEVGALFVIIGAGVTDQPNLIFDLGKVFPAATDLQAWKGIGAAGLLAFFAFIGFEDMVNLAEEVKQPRRTMPWAIVLTLGLGTLIYFLVTAVAVLSVSIDDLAASRVPVSFIFSRITGAPPAVITAIAIVATLNGVVIQMIMASRVLYGLGKQGSLPSVFSHVNSRTQTPLFATGFVVLIILVLSLAFPVQELAEMTSRLVLGIFTLVNLALFLIKMRRDQLPEGAFETWIWVPAFGVVTCLALLATDLI